MKVLVIPDMHLKTWMFKLIREIPENLYDKIVFLGDFVDEFNQQANRQLYQEMLEQVKSFVVGNPKVHVCLGNHDISYVYEWLESGFSFPMCSYVRKFMDQFITEPNVSVIHKIDNVLFSHGGLSDLWIDNYLDDYFQIDRNCHKLEKSVDNIVKVTNSMLAIKDTAQSLWMDVAPLWLRPNDDYSIYRLHKQGELYQVMGHTPVKCTYVTKDYALVDSFSLYSDGFTPYGDRELIIIDTETKSVEFVSSLFTDYFDYVKEYCRGV